MSYIHKYPLFRDLTEKQVKEFRDYAIRHTKKGIFGVEIELIHPVIRKELIRLIEESLRKQGEL